MVAAASGGLSEGSIVESSFLEMTRAGGDAASGAFFRKKPPGITSTNFFFSTRVEPRKLRGTVFARAVGDSSATSLGRKLDELNKWSLELLPRALNQKSAIRIAPANDRHTFPFHDLLRNPTLDPAF